MAELAEGLAVAGAKTCSCPAAGATCQVTFIRKEAQITRLRWDRGDEAEAGEQGIDRGEMTRT